MSLAVDRALGPTGRLYRGWIRALPRLSSADVPLYPVAVAAAYLLNAYLDSPATVQALWRPLAVIVLVAALMQLVAGVALRNRHRGALLAFVLTALLFAPPTMSLPLVGVVAIAMLAGLIVALVGTKLRRMSIGGLPWASVTRLLNVVGGVMLALAFWATLSAGALTSSGPPARDPAAKASPESPDIYVILLDGYPRADTLLNDFGFDNEPFLQAMTERGFDVSRESHSNYNMTVLTITSMLNMAYVHDIIPAPPDEPVAQSRALTSSIAEAAGLKLLRQNGYEIVAIPSEYLELTAQSADRVLDSGDVTEFELSMLQKGLSRFLLADVQSAWLTESHRHRIQTTFARLEELAAEHDGAPKFVFAHLLTPHLPFVFGPNGERNGPWPCFPSRCSLWSDGYQFPGGDYIDLTQQRPYVEGLRDQLSYVNAALLGTVDSIITRSARPPVIVVLSDHGHRHDAQDREEVFRSIFLARTPGNPSVFPSDASPINMLARVANAYLDADLSLMPDERYFLDMTRITIAGLFNVEHVNPR